MRQAGTVQRFHERLGAPVSWWGAAVLFGLVWGWVALVVSTWTAAVVVAVLVAAALCALVWRYGHGVRVSVDDDGLHAGPARLEAAHVGAVDALDRAATRHLLGPGANARAWLLVRPYVRTAVRVDVADPADPTPYWLVSTRHPQALVTALLAVRPRGESRAPLQED